MKITIDNLKENRAEIIEHIEGRGFTTNCDLKTFMNKIISELPTWEYDEEETMLYNIQLLCNDIYRMNFSDSAVKKARKDNNPNSLRNTMSRLHEDETNNFLNKEYSKN